MICTPAERDLIVAGATRLVAPGDRVRNPAEMRPQHVNTVSWVFVAPQRWVDATGPCPTCDGRHSWRGGTNRFTCLDCIDGRKREALQVECPCWEGWTAMSGKPCPPPCGRCEFGLVTFAYVTVEVLPVADWRDAHCYRCARLNPDGITISVMTADNREYMHPGDPITLDPLPVPGRDWVVLLDNVGADVSDRPWIKIVTITNIRGENVDVEATDVDGLAAYAEDDNVFWRMDSGHHQNIIDELIAWLT